MKTFWYFVRCMLNKPICVDEWGYVVCLFCGYQKKEHTNNLPRISKKFRK